MFLSFKTIHRTLFLSSKTYLQDDLAVSDDSDDEDKDKGHKVQPKQEPVDPDDPMAFWGENHHQGPKKFKENIFACGKNLVLLSIWIG